LNIPVAQYAIENSILCHRYILLPPLSELVLMSQDRHHTHLSHTVLHRELIAL
jgi:hypothetical protein